MELKSGVTLQGGKYRIISTLGRGGFGVTYLAEQTGMQRNVCIKEFFPKDYYRRDGDTSRVVLEADSFGPMMARFKEKFLKEARTIALFKHPNIVTIHDVFEENDTAYYVMEYIEGRSLKNLVKERGVLSSDEARRYIGQAASALDYVHLRNTVHLDIKPDNIMLSDEDDSAILIDFGLAKHYDEAGAQTSSTPIGISAGYAPLEQYQRVGVSQFQPATDIYSLGATLYTLVTGALPPEASVVNEEGVPALPEKLDEGVRCAINASMRGRVKERPANIAAFMSLLNSDGAGATVAAASATVDAPKVQPKPASVKRSASIDNKEPKKRSKWWLWLLLLAIVGGGVFAYLNSQPKDNPKLSDEHTTIVPDTIEEVDSVKVVAPLHNEAESLPEPEPIPDPILSLSKREINVPYSRTNGSIGYAVENPIDGVSVRVSENEDWLFTSVDEDKIRYTVTQNDLYEQRSTTFTVSYGDQSVEVAITQNGKPAPAPDPVLRLTSDSRVTVEHGGGNGTIRYTLENPVSGVNLSVSDDASWLTTSRSGNTISYSASANESQSSRTAIITVSYGDQSFEVSITQSGSNYTESGGGYGISMKMVWVEGGTFQMGSTNEKSDEQPVHTVTLSGYWIAETEVTQAQWEAVMGTTVRQQRDLKDPSEPLRGEGNNYPMYYVNYTEALEFCRRLSSATGKRYTLPTEAQWEYAALGGQRANGTIFTYSGSNIIGNVAWYKDNSSSQTLPVKQKAANQLGLYDMSGNVWEWCLDWYSSSYYGSSPQNNPQGPNSGQSRVLRGGSWGRYASYCRVANRDYFSPSFRYDGSGFRVVCLP